MNRQQFEDILQNMSDKYKVGDCPEDAKEQYWEVAQHLKPEVLERSLENHFQKMQRYTEADKAEVMELKKEIGRLFLRLLSSEAGHYVINNFCEFFKLDIDIDEDSLKEAKRLFEEMDLEPTDKQTADYKWEPDDKDMQCPDALTPDVLKILLGKHNKKGTDNE